MTRKHKVGCLGFKPENTKKTLESSRNGQREIHRNE